MIFNYYVKRARFPEGACNPSDVRNKKYLYQFGFSRRQFLEIFLDTKPATTDNLNFYIYL